jgi:phosphoribosylamine--glycine ligase
MENDRAYARRVAAEHSVQVTDACLVDSLEAFESVIPRMGSWGGCVIKYNCSNTLDVKTELYQTPGEGVMAMKSRPKYKYPSTVEDLVHGCEISFSVLVDYRTDSIIPMCTDFEYTKFGTGDVGCETSEMGSHVLAGVGIRPISEIFERLIPWFREVRYIGWFNASCIYDPVADKLVVFEFMTRLGRCEFETSMFMMKSDFSEIVTKLASSKLKADDIKWRAKHGVAVGVVDSYSMVNDSKNSFEIYGPSLDLMSNRFEDKYFSRQNCSINEEGRFFSKGPTVFNATGIGNTYGAACDNAYQVAKECRFNGAYYRKDIGHRITDRHLLDQMIFTEIVPEGSF